MDNLEDVDTSNIKNGNNSNNNSVFESPEVEDKKGKAGIIGKSGLVFEMTNFAEGKTVSVSSDGKRLESEEFENISISAVENIPSSNMTKTSKDALPKVNGNKTEASEEETDKPKGLKVVGGSNKKRSSSYDCLKFEIASDVIVEEDGDDDLDDESIVTANSHLESSKEEILESDSKKVGNKTDKDVCTKEVFVNKRCGSENDILKLKTAGDTKDLKKNNSPEHTSIFQGRETRSEEGFKYAGRVVSIKEHYGHMMESRRRSESWLVNSCEKPRDNYRKHSSGDLHSRLKTRKLLGVGETDDGDVHRSKLSQILGHSDQLYIRLPSGLRFWQIILAVIFSVLSLWALVFPGHYFYAMYDMDGSSFTFPIRLYACALISISVMYWSTVQAADRHVIRMILLSSVVFFTLQSGVLMTTWLPWLPSTSPTSFLCSVFIAFVARLLVIAISSYFYWITYKDGKSKDVKYYR